MILLNHWMFYKDFVRQPRALNDHEKYQLLTSVQEGLTDDDLDTKYYNVTGIRKRKQITCRRRWLAKLWY